jgi:hypothetical protein
MGRNLPYRTHLPGMAVCPDTWPNLQRETRDWITDRGLGTIMMIFEYISLFTETLTETQRICPQLQTISRQALP